MPLTKTERLHLNVRPITRMIIEKMAEEERTSMTEIIEQAVLRRARKDHPELVDVGGTSSA